MTTKFIQQVKKSDDGEWMAICSTRGEWYFYADRERAEHFLRTFYPDQHRIGLTRVVEESAEHYPPR